MTAHKAALAAVMSITACAGAALVVVLLRAYLRGGRLVEWLTAVQLCG